MLKLLSETFGPFMNWVLWGEWSPEVEPILVLLGIAVIGPLILVPLVNKFGKNKNKGEE